MSLIEAVHDRHVLRRRARVLSNLLADVIPRHARLLDVGCGDGEIARQVGQIRPDLQIRGVDVLVRPDACIPVELHDGERLPYDDKSYDVITLIDVLHHCDAPLEVLRESTRVARRAVVIKDHTREGLAATSTLRLMDSVGNYRHGIALPYNYWRRSEWQNVFDQLGMETEVYLDRLNLYPWPASVVFDRSLHFIARLSVPGYAFG